MNNGMQTDFEEIFDVIIAFYKERDYYDLLDSILVKMMDITHADGGTLYVLENSKLHFRIMRNLSQNIYLSAKDKIEAAPISLEEDNIKNISAYAALKNEIIAIDDVYNNTEFNFAGPKQYDEEHQYRTQSMLVFPLTATGNYDEQLQVIGVIQLINSIDPETGQPRSFGNIFDPPVLPALSNISANALANILYVQEIQELFNSFVRVMTKAIDERTPYNVNHTNNVAKYCGAFARFLGSHFEKGHPLYFDKSRREQLVMAAYLHDIGKLITPLEVMDKSDRLGNELPILHLKLELKAQQTENQVLKGEMTREEQAQVLQDIQKAIELMDYCNTAPYLEDSYLPQVARLSQLTMQDAQGQTVPIFTPANIESLQIQSGTLTPAERKIMQDHVSVTERLLKEMSFNRYYKNVPKWASHHHEFSDGSGYPHGLSGDEIQPEESILAMVDIFDAMTAIDRPYKKSLSAEKTLDILRDMAEKNKFPLELVELFAQARVWESKEEPTD